jgi:hypothetical protein
VITVRADFYNTLIIGKDCPLIVNSQRSSSESPDVPAFVPTPGYTLKPDAKRLTDNLHPFESIEGDAT